MKRAARRGFVLRFRGTGKEKGIQQMTDTEFLRALPQREFPRGFTRELLASELSRLIQISQLSLRPGASIHTPVRYGNVHEARMLLATIT